MAFIGVTKWWINGRKIICCLLPPQKLIESKVCYYRFMKSVTYTDRTTPTSLWWLIKWRIKTPQVKRQCAGITE